MLSWNYGTSCKMMMLGSSVEMIVLSGVVHCQPNPEKMNKKREIRGHQCGAYHKVSNAKIRMA